jgi:hypothetical protein
MCKKELQQQDVEKVIAELRNAGIKVSTGNVEVANKPTINSNNGG